ncbi:hypothetical protein ACTXT7_003691, partial [Hymenolepis weldensis]
MKSSKKRQIREVKDCISITNRDALGNLTLFYNTTALLLNEHCVTSNKDLQPIIQAMSDACPETESLKIVTKALINFIQPSCSTTKLTFNEINKWIGSVQSVIKLQKDFANMVEDKRIKSASTENIYLNGFLKDIAAIANLSDAQYYSTSMQALSTFAPTVRFSEKIKFLENVDETLALVCSDLLQHNEGGITFIYDDSN